MASGDGDGGIAEVGEAATPARNRRTIYDYLGEGDDGTDEAASPPSPDTPPRLRLPLFTCATIRFGRKRGGRSGRKETAAAEKSEDASVDSSSGWKQPAAGTCSVSGGGVGGSVAAGGQTGMGLSMLFLLARTCVELNRMAEVRAQMETLLKEVRDEASRVKGGGGAADDHVVPVTPKACDNNRLQSSSSSTTTTTTASSSSCVSDGGTSTTNCLVEIRRAEDDGERASGAELETEPAAARRHHPPEYNKCDTEHDTADQCSVQSWSSSDDDGGFIELEGGRFGTGAGDPQRGAAAVDESDGDDESCDRRHEGGVSATELERRLHELQHRRDGERIAALETALRRARRRLTEKEMEARLWQDTATLALGQPVPRDGRQSVEQ